ncbi:MAG: 23S rRNA (adenine(2503)-C(2))-methyltransferase RlmN [Myxococcales bacterium]
MSRPHLAGFNRDALAAERVARGEKPGAAKERAHALVSWFAGRRDEPSWAGDYECALPFAEPVVDPDGTVRFAVRLGDGAVVETVLIRQPSRTTVCLSSQVGCARGCVFCETGRLGLVRNLEAWEIVAQYAIAARHVTEERALPATGGGRRPEHAIATRPGNVVFMGMGEPLDNLEEVLRAIDVLADPAGFAVPERRITVSTVGIVPKMDEMYRRSRANVAVSLHALDPTTRLALLPVARRYPLDDLRAALSRSPRTVLLQWTLIAGRNDADGDADALADFARGLDVRVNLIPLNPGPDPSLLAPPLEHCRAFQKRLADRGVRTLLRLPHGQSVGGACGQLSGRLRASQGAPLNA